MVYDLRQYTNCNTLVKQKTRRGHFTEVAVPCSMASYTSYTNMTTSLLGRLFCSDSQLWIRKRYSHQKHRWYNLSWLSIYFPFVFSIQHHNTYDNDILRQIHQPLTHLVVFLHLARHLNFPAHYCLTIKLFDSCLVILLQISS